MLLVTSIYLALGIVAFVVWGATGNIAWVDSFFKVPGALLLVWLALIEFWLSHRVRQHFQPGEALHNAWIWINLSALCHFLGESGLQVLGLRGGISPLAHLPNWTPGAAEAVRQLGQTLGGPFRYGLLAAGLFSALKAHRQAGLLGRLRVTDWMLLALAGAYVVMEFAGVVTAIRHGKHPSLIEVSHWPVDPLLVLLCAEALLLHRSIRNMGVGWIGRCWSMYSMGVFLVLLGDLGLWLTAYGYLISPWNSLVWYIWLPAGCAFALAPAYQLETIFQAVSGKDGIRQSNRVSEIDHL
jgi:hypothetical protein